MEEQKEKVEQVSFWKLMNYLLLISICWTVFGICVAKIVHDSLERQKYETIMSVWPNGKPCE